MDSSETGMIMKKRILILGLNFSPELIGIGKFTGELAESLSVLGYQVRVISTPPYYPAWKISEGYSRIWYRKERIGNIEVIRCPLWVPRQVTGLRRVLLLFSFALSSFPAMLLSIGWQADGILCVVPTLLSTPWAILLSKIMNIPAWCHIHDFELDASLELNVFSKKSLITRSLYWLEKVLLKEFDRVSTISNRMLKVLHAKGVDNSKTTLIRNWVDTSLVYPIGETSPYRRSLNISEDQIVILYSGNFGMKQGIEILLDAAAHLSNQPEITFVLSGDGAGRNVVVSRAESLPNVKLIPLQPYDRLNELLNLADIHILPQRSGFADLVMPSKLAGMLASGKPVIATTKTETGVGAIVDKVGLLVPPGESKTLATAILSLSQDKDLRFSMGSAGRQVAESQFDKRVILSNFETQLLKFLI